MAELYCALNWQEVRFYCTLSLSSGPQGALIERILTAQVKITAGSGTGGSADEALSYLARAHFKCGAGGRFPQRSDIYVRARP
jgi:hypothetical protein